MGLHDVVRHCVPCLLDGSEGSIDAAAAVARSAVTGNIKGQLQRIQELAHVAHEAAQVKLQDPRLYIFMPRHRNFIRQ